MPPIPPPMPPATLPPIDPAHMDMFMGGGAMVPGAAIGAAMLLGITAKLAGPEQAGTGADGMDGTEAGGTDAATEQAGEWEQGWEQEWAMQAAPPP